MIDKIVIMGPPPGAPGGIGMMMRHLENSAGLLAPMEFVDSGTTSRRLRSFLAAVLRCVRSSQGELFHLNIASRGSTFRKAILAAVTALTGRKYILHLHGAEYREFYSGSNFLAKAGIRALFQNAARVIVLGETWARFVIDTLGVSETRVGILPNAVPGPPALPDRSDMDIRMLFIGRSGKRKGLYELLDAVSTLPENGGWSMVLAGDAADTQARESLNETSFVDYLGWIDQESLAEELSRAAIFVLPSHAEGLPLALLDAMAWGLAPIVTNVGSISDVITDGENGIFVDVGDARGLASAMASLLVDHELRRRLGRNARATWLAHYDSSQYLERLNQQYSISLDNEDLA